MKCPYCGTDNIDGVDECESCFEPLTDFDRTASDKFSKQFLLTDSVKNLKMSRTVFVSENDTVMEAAVKMNEANVGCALIVSEGKGEPPKGDSPKSGSPMVSGVVTERDILYKVFSNKLDHASVKVSEIMTPNPEFLSEETPIAYALHMMSIGGFRHVPILKDNKVCGVVSVRDILAYLAGIFSG